MGITETNEATAEELASVAEWVGLHYRKNFDAMDAKERSEWVSRYRESHSSEV